MYRRIRFLVRFWKVLNPAETKKLSNKDYIAQIKSIEEENFLLNKSKVKYTIITKSGGFLINGCK